MPWSCHLRGSIVMHVWEPFSSEYLSDLSHADCVGATVYTAKMWWSHNFVSSGNGFFHWKWLSIKLSMNIIQQTNKQIDNNLLYWSVLSKETTVCQNVPNITMKPLACSWWFHLTLAFWTFRHLSIVHIN